MNFIAVDTTSSHMTLIVNRNNISRVLFEKDCGVKHSVALMPALEKLLIEQRMTLDDVDFIACVTGPGSFTGIRIGISTVKAMAFACNKPVLSVTSFDTLAYNKLSERVLTVIDAGHGGYYIAGYDNGIQDIKPQYVLEEKVKELSFGRECISLCPIERLSVQSVDPAEGLKAFCEKNVSNVNKDPDSLRALYIRKSQAEEGR